jgi:anti-anti-sigma regulatory factor
MTVVNPPEVSVVKSVTVISPGTDFSNLYESLIDQLGITPQFLEQLNPPKLLIDMKNVKFVGSAFLGRMVFVHKTLGAREAGRVAMCGLNSFCLAALSVSKLDTVLEVFSTVDDGVAAFGS